MAVSGGVRQAALSLRSPQTLATSVDSSWRRRGPGAWDGRACSREVHLGSLFLFDPAIQQAKIGAGRGEEEDLKVSQGSIRLWCQGPTPRSLAASSANCRGAGQAAPPLFDCDNDKETGGWRSSVGACACVRGTAFFHCHGRARQRVTRPKINACDALYTHSLFFPRVAVHNQQPLTRHTSLNQVN